MIDEERIEEPAAVEEQNIEESKGQDPLVEADSEVERLKRENAELKDKYLRALADFDNLRKRSLKERSDLLKYQGEKIIYELLTVLDTIEMALSHQDADPQQIKQGVQLIHKLFIDTLNKWDVRPVPALGNKFDPNYFEALQRVPTADVVPGTIINEAIKGYFYKDKLLRHGKVIISSELTESSQQQTGDGQPEDAGDSDK